MLKKILPNLYFFLAYLITAMLFGSAIYYFFLMPQNALLNDKNTTQNLSTNIFFATNLPNENGVTQALSQYKGKIIVLNFWATWCPPCREEMPELSALHTKFSQKNVVVLGIAIDELALIKEFAIQTPVSYPLFAAEDEGMAIGSSLGNDKGVLPYTVIIDSNGRLVNKHFGRITETLLTTNLIPLLK